MSSERPTSSIASPDHTALPHTVAMDPSERTPRRREYRPPRPSVAAAHGHVAIVGPGEGASEPDVAAAEDIAAALAEAGHVIVTGGLGGVMRAAAIGARRAGGLSIGLLPGATRADGAPEHAVLIPTGLGELRNGLVVRAADVVVAVGGSWGTLSELALAVRTGVPVITLGGWAAPAHGPIAASSPAEAVELAVRALAEAQRG